jgi:hypothetical protein
VRACATPSPATPSRAQQEEGFDNDLRSGGYTGRIIAGPDLPGFPIPADQ